MTHKTLKQTFFNEIVVKFLLTKNFTKNFQKKIPSMKTHFKALKTR